MNFQCIEQCARDHSRLRQSILLPDPSGHPFLDLPLAKHPANFKCRLFEGAGASKSLYWVNLPYAWAQMTSIS